jgi:SulP family sulfate permease
MSEPVPAAPPGAWLQELLAGGVAALVTLALLLSLGVLAFTPLGADAARVGAAAAFTCSALSALIYALAAGSRLPTGAPTAPTTLMVATLVGSLLLDPAQPPAGASLPLAWLVAAVALSVVVCGLVQLLMALCGLVELVRKVPQPVLAGFMNAIAVLVLLAQFGPLLGFTSAALAQQGLAALQGLRPGSLLLGLGTALLVLQLVKRRPRWPAALIAVLAGTLVYQLLRWLQPGLDLGPAVGALALELPITQAWAALADGGCQAFLQRHALIIVGTGAGMAVVAALESMLVVLALDQQFGERSDTRRELTAIGAANLVGGLCGALPLGTVRSRAAAVMQAGGHGRRAAAAACLASGAVFLVGSALLAWLPAAVLGGIMLTVAWALVDPWTRSRVRQAWAGERSPDLALALVVVAIVLVTTVWRGPLYGVGLGMLLALLLFVRLLSRALVRSRYNAAQRPSRRVYPLATEARLAPLRPAVVVLELEGALFFGNAEQLNQAADTLVPECQMLVLDLRRVGIVDETGAHALTQLAPRLRQRRTRLLLAHVQQTQPLGRRLALFGVAGADGVDWFADVDHAIEAAEQALLATASHLASQDAAVASAPAALDDNVLCEGLDAAEIELVRRHLQALQLQPGAAVFRQGERADAVYLVARGSVSIVAPRSGNMPGTRYASLSPGTLFGEAAVLDGGGRTADAVADGDTELLRLDEAALAELARKHPELGARLYRNLAGYLARRLRIASGAWAAAAG